MRLLLVSEVNPWVRSVATVHHYIDAGRALGHDIAVYGEPHKDLPGLPHTTDLKGVDYAIFVIQVSSDLPDMPYLARVLDGISRERRVVVDLWGRFNDTIRLEHDFNHLEKLDGHAGWEWEDALSALSDTILQPSLSPLRENVSSFLFHGFDPGSVAKPRQSAREAAAAWAGKAYGVAYVGSNWQRWDEVRRLLEGYAPVRDWVGRFCLAGWDWNAVPEWAAKMGLKGIDTDPALLARTGVEVRDGVRFEEILPLLGQARFAPVLHRPLFRQLGFVTNRTFETFHADTLPLLLLPRDFVKAIYGEAALALVPGDDISAYLNDVLKRPETYWDAVLQTRTHLARHHSYARRFEQLGELLKKTAPPGGGR